MTPRDRGRMSTGVQTPITCGYRRCYSTTSRSPLTVTTAHHYPKKVPLAEMSGALHQAEAFLAWQRRCGLPLEAAFERWSHSKYLTPSQRTAYWAAICRLVRFAEPHP